MLLADLVRTSREVAATRSRTAKTELLADALRSAGPAEVGLVATYLAGAPRQRRTGLGWRSLADLPAPATETSLEVVEVDEALEAISALSGTGSGARRGAAVQELFGRATDDEQEFLRALVLGNLRQGALDSLLLDAVARAADVPVTVVRRAAMFTPVSGDVAAAAFAGGRDALDAFGLVPGRPVRPMLASSAADVAAAMEKVGAEQAPALVDRKLDGIRVQVHRVGEEVTVYTRSLDDITARLPEVVAAVRRLPADVLVLDGEVLALGPDGRPRPFQETSARTVSAGDAAGRREGTPVTPLFFDVLHADGRDLLDEPALARHHVLVDLLPDELRVPRTTTDDPAVAKRFFEDAVAAGHEGVVVKSSTATYDAGRRGAGWVKVKPRHTLDLVVLAVEWGSGRRQGLLSNIHLGARDPEADGFVMLGKTFKGMTDEMLRWQTERFLGLESHRDGHVVHLRPEQVVEIAFDGIQRSSRYPGGMALRFARVLRYRDDKTASEADTLADVRRLHDGA